MNKTILRLTVMSVVGYFVSRAFIELCVMIYFSKGKYKLYREQTSWRQRYWLIWIMRNSRRKYLRSENRQNNYPTIMTIYFCTHIVLFVSLIITEGIAVSVIIGCLNMRCAEKALGAYLVEVLLSFVIYFFIEIYEHREYHKKRNKRWWLLL